MKSTRKRKELEWPEKIISVLKANDICSLSFLIRFMDKMDYVINPLVHAVEEIKTSCKCN
jgi:hypothetical protein